MNPISVEGFRKPDAAPSPGPAPIQQWIEIALLRVDPSYQRPIKGSGPKNVARIAAEFDWSKFAPVVVAPIEGGLFAIVDGQHRTTAAALIGVERVPCHIIQADAGQQARAFAAINGVVTPMFTGALWHARLQGGDKAARRLAAVLDAADVSITRFPVEARKMKPGETGSVKALENALARYGRETLITALQCIAQTGDGHVGLVRAAVVTAFCEVLHQAHYWRDAGDALFRAIDDLGLGQLYEREFAVRSPTAKPIVARLADAIRHHLTVTLGTPATRAQP